MRLGKKKPVIDIDDIDKIAQTIERADDFAECFSIVEKTIKFPEQNQALESAIRKAVWFANQNQCIELILILFRFKKYYHPSLRLINDKIRLLKQAS